MSIDERGELFDYSLINEIAIRALSIAQDARDRVRRKMNCGCR